MNTNTILLDGKKEADIEAAGAILKNGGLVAIPTETVYGLAANALNEEAVKNIFKTKGRPADNPLIVHISDLSELSDLVSEIPETALRLADAFWPGPLTIIMKKSGLIPDIVSGGLNTVGIRLPSSETARKIIKASGCPLAAPSANISGKPSPTEFEHVKDDLYGKVEALVDGGTCSVGVESTVITLAADTPKILRPGGITRLQLEEVIGHVDLDPAITAKPDIDLKPSSPGMKYTHYSPKANVFVVDSSPVEYANYVNSKPGSFSMCFDEDIPGITGKHISYGTRYDGALQAKNLFSTLLQLDELGAKNVFARIPSKNGIGLAVYNRLIRSAGFKIVNPLQHHIIGLTGASGTGKTTIGKVMEELGCYVIDCDKVSKSDSVYDEACIAELTAAFGSEIAENGVLQRKKLAKIAFSSKEGTSKLNSITHPRILTAVLEKIKLAETMGFKLIVMDAPTLFQANFDSRCSRIIVVTASYKTRLDRIMKRDGISLAEAEKRLSAGLDDSYYLKRADHIIDGEGGYDLVKRLNPIVEGLSNIPEIPQI